MQEWYIVLSHCVGSVHIFETICDKWF